MIRPSLHDLSLAAAALAAILLGAPASTQACGGFFCSQSGPVNQSRERIVFAHNDDGTVTALIQVMYEGPAHSFAWVLPVTGVPEVGVSSNQVFDLLDQRTAPRYYVEYDLLNGDQCSGGDGDGDGDGDGVGFLDAGASSDAGIDAPPVIVLARGDAGPYDYEVIAVNMALDDKVTPAAEWLATNGYDLPEGAAELLRPYLEDGMNLIAFRLDKRFGSGAIRPIALTYDNPLPSIPIRPTAVAANEDMGVLVWVLASERAIPKNYLHLELNEALIDWFNPQPRYDQVVTAAADEAGGQGFVTELSESTADYGENFIPDSFRSQWQTLAESDRDGLTLLIDAADVLRGWEGLDDAIALAVTLPDGLSLEEFASCPGCYTAVSVDGAALREAITELVVDPVYDTQALITAHPRISRLYTTMSPAEMTTDPVFDLNPDLPGVSNQHSLTLHWDACTTEWEAELPNGLGTVRGKGNVWPIGLDEGLPANLRITMLSTVGLGRVVLDNLEDLQSMLGALQPDAGGVDGPRAGANGADEGEGGGAASRHEGCGCAVPGARAHPGAELAWIAPLLAALGLRARRRRAR